MPNQSGRIVLVLILILLVAGTLFYFFFPSLKKDIDYIEQAPDLTTQQPPTISQDSNESSNQAKTYFSENFDFNITPPIGFRIEDNFPILTLNDGTNKIEIVRNGTNFDNLERYIQDFDSKRKIQIISSQQKNINNYPVLERIIGYEDQKGQQKSIYLYVDNYVYIFTTKKDSLYPVLDQIVQSFEYKP